jgi:protein-tyrosine phosphatase
VAANLSPESDVPLDVLFVCTANVCRSPMAELMMRQELARYPDAAIASWRIASAGVDAKVGAPIHPYAAAALAEVGVEADGSTARQMTPELIGRSRLVLTATRWHRSVVVEESPGAIRRVFTIRQFARMCVAGVRLTEVAPDPTVDSLVATALRGRTNLQPSADDDGIDDPIGGDLDQFRTCRDLIEVSVDWILSAFAAG